ncbi:MAG: type II CRISPR-associated endonuclease Cas1 [Candidatus Borkfalkiaceae bacterium]|nr:type II CRISPR-associated endonuclease Cas1 [Christensenellaceae bacterium]
MGFRTVVVNSRSKLEFRLNFLIIRGETERRIYINEINTLIVQSTAVSLTAALLSELIHNNVKVVFCDEKCNPSAELLPYYGAHNTSKRIKVQANWSIEAKDEIWKTLITKKILCQSELLLKNGFLTESEMLKEYAAEVVAGDLTNREGHAAKVYFNAILPDGVTRRSVAFVNGCLNYGYAVLLSAINREIVAAGYITQLGIWHDNEFNCFNLGSDLMEPLRPIVDETALSMLDGDKDFKRKMANILNYETVFGGKKTTLDIAVRQYVKSVFCALEENKPDLVVFPECVKIEV